MRLFVRCWERIKSTNWAPALPAALALSLVVTGLGATLTHVAGQVSHFWG